MAAFRKYTDGARRMSFWLPVPLIEALVRASATAGVSQTEWLQGAIRDKLPPDTEPSKPSVFG